MHAPMTDHILALKRVVRYLQGTVNYGLNLYKSSTCALTSYTDADWPRCPDTRNADAEYRGVANIVSEACWLHNPLFKLHYPLTKATIVCCDNVISIYLFENPVQHQRTEHVELDIHFVCEKVALGHVRVLQAPFRYHIDDIGLPLIVFIDFRDSLSVRPPPNSTERVY
ncbi:hypothetical protein LIER_41772 [Lithospermum erythrorhizon]|uniref:Uncharacterized protein n=1 Tax=Lithospermum erythrorhizon TaxID=34254 RepID=A0AAV3RIC8_LITER